MLGDLIRIHRSDKIISRIVLLYQKWLVCTNSQFQPYFADASKFHPPANIDLRYRHQADKFYMEHVKSSKAIGYPLGGGFVEQLH